MSTSLEMRDIEKRYGEFRAVRDFNLLIEPGEFVSFLGPSGSGKTTALKMIAGFETPSAGGILLGGRSIVDLPPYERDIGMVFQNYALFPHMTVFDNVAFPLTVRRTGKAETEEKVRHALTLVKMDTHGDRYPNQLSGGQQQRIALARAIVFNPSILLMDEPLGALDRKLREHMKLEIMRIQDELNITVVFVTHDQDEALTMSDRVAVLNEGHLVQVADSKTLYNRPKNRFVASFVGESNLLPCQVLSAANGAGEVLVGGKMPVRAHLSGQGTGDDGWLFLRPEHIDIKTPASSATAQTTMDGIVEEALYLGEMTRYTVRCGDMSITIRQQNRGQTPFSPESPVLLSWSADNALVLD